MIVSPKTRNSERTIPLVAGTAEALRAHRGRQASERVAAGAVWVESGHVFTDEGGAPMGARRVLGWWHELTKEAGVGRRRFHASPHTCATLLLNQGVPLEVVSAILGHANLGITSDIHAKVNDDTKRRRWRCSPPPLSATLHEHGPAVPAACRCGHRRVP